MNTFEVFVVALILVANVELALIITRLGQKKS
jgi:hypothetical protein